MKKIIFCISLSCSACGFSVPEISRSGQSQVFVWDVHYRIQCEIKDAVKLASLKQLQLRAITGVDNDFFENWGVKYQLTLKTIHSSSTEPSATLGTTDFPTVPPRVSVFTLGAGLGLSATATATTTAQNFATVSSLRSEPKCDPDELESIKNIVPSGGNLGVSDWLITQISLVEGRQITSITSKEPFTYEIGFDVQTSAKISPGWKFTNRDWSNAGLALSGSRKTSHSVLFTFGPLSDDQKNLDANALAVHNRLIAAD